MKKNIFLCLCFAATAAAGQTGEELLVYSIRGNVTVIENNQETKARIGKVLKAGSSIRAQRLSRITMVCKQGKPLSVTKEGTYPVVRWKDSCNADQHSVTSRYFQFVWDQLYIRSDDYKKKHPEAIGAVTRDDAPVRGQEELEIETTLGLDTVQYAGAAFALTWRTNLDYAGNYFFSLTDVKTGKTVYSDSLATRQVWLTDLRKYLRAGKMYSWSVGAPKTSTTEGGIIRCWPSRKSGQVSRKMQRMVNVPEEPAAAFFRTAYLLESEYWLANAWQYYQKAVKTAPGEEFYREQLEAFEKRYRLSRVGL